jgi:hypothetical protein
MNKIFTLIFLLVSSGFATAQNNVGINTTPDASAVLDVSSSDKGVLVPRMTKAQRNLISTPATGLLIFQTDDTPGFYFNSGSTTVANWTALSGSTLPSQSGNGGRVLTTNGTSLQWQMPSTGSALLIHGYVAASNSFGNGTNYPTGSGWNTTESDGHRVLLSNASTIKLVAALSGSSSTTYTLSLRKGTPSGGSYIYSDLSNSTISISNSNVQTLNLSGLSLNAGETICIKIVGTAAMNSHQKTLTYSLLVQ